MFKVAIFLSLHAIVTLLHLPEASCQWSVSVNFVNECEESIDIEIQSDESSDSAVLEEGSDFSHIICSSLCTGFLGASKTYSYSWDATASDSSCDFTASGSGSISISGFDALGASEEVTIPCGNMVCDGKDTEDTMQSDTSTSDDVDTPAPVIQSTSGNGCTDLSSGSSPSKSDGLAALSAKVSNAVYSDDVPEYQNEMQSLIGASCADIFFNDKDAEVAVAVNDDSIFIVFRGSSSETDWLDTNANAGLKDVDVNGKTIRFHEGFFDAWKAAEKDVISIIEKYPGRDVYLSGHSLGGALSQIAAYMLEQENNVPVKAVYTFGAPPAGDESWRSAVSDSGLASNTINFIHPDDPVPFLRYAVDSSLLTSLLASLAASAFGGDISGLRDLRLAGRSVIVTSSSCEESDPVFNDFEWKFDDHAIGQYESNILANCIPESSKYPDCTPSSISSSYSGTCAGDPNPPKTSSLPSSVPTSSVPTSSESTTGGSSETSSVPSSQGTGQSLHIFAFISITLLVTRYIIL